MVLDLEALKVFTDLLARSSSLSKGHFHSIVSETAMGMQNHEKEEYPNPPALVMYIHAVYD